MQICALRVADENVRRVADKLYEDLKKAGVEVIYDDRNISAGVMFSDADLLGVPLRIVVSPKTLERNAIEFASPYNSASAISASVSCLTRPST